MRIQEPIYSAITALLANKTRAILTMLGVVIGVFAVVSLVAVVKGLENQVTKEFSSLGSNLIIVAPGRARFNQDPSLSFTNNKLKVEYTDTIQKGAGDYILGITPNSRVGKEVERKGKGFFASLIGTGYAAPSVITVELLNGRFFTQAEQKASAKVAVIGYQVKEELFGSAAAIGDTLTIDGRAFEIIGELSKKGHDADERIYVPYTTVQNVLGIKKLSGITIKAVSSVDIDKAMLAVRIALLSELKSDEFTVLSQKDILDSIGNILNILSVGLGAIAAISLLVGGIGIMNIMLVSVNERVREIGLRKALGATAFNVGFQFFTEAVVISLSGGVFGLIMAFLLVLLLKNFFQAQIPLWSVGVGLGFSLITGALFGTYPALKASRKDPIEALRYE